MKALVPNWAYFILAPESEDIVMAKISNNVARPGYSSNTLTIFS
jgi:hypothetical protein